jgi:endonuclease III related protein
MPSKSPRRNAAHIPQAAHRLRAMYDHLVALWGPQQWWPAQSAFEVIIGAYLTQNTAWTSVERSIANLRSGGALSIANLRSGGALSIDGLRAVSEEDLRILIRPSGFMLRKAAALKSFIAFLDARFDGSIEALRQAAAADAPVVREQLLALLGVGPETADAILLYALSVPAMVVDEYLRRIVTRHALIHEKAKYPEIQALAEQALASESGSESPADRARHYNEFHALMVQIGKLHCGRTPRCENCPLAYDLKQPGVPYRNS